MAVYNLTGSGVQGLSSGQSQLLVDITSFDVHRSVGRAAPPNYYDLGLLRLGQQGSYRPTFPLDSTSMVIDLPDKTDVLGYSLFGTTAIRVTEVAPVATGNPLRIIRYGSQSPPASSGATVLWTYTVPANRVCRVSYLMALIANGAPSGNNAQVNLNGNLLLFATPDSTHPTSGFGTMAAPTPFWLVASDVLTAYAIIGTTSSSSCTAHMIGAEIDAAAWVPN